MSSAPTLASVYTEALARYEQLHREEKIKDWQLALIKEQTNLNDVLSTVKEAETKNEGERNVIDRLFHRISPQIISKIDRFSGVVDTAIQSRILEPEISALVWSSIKFILIVLYRNVEIDGSISITFYRFYETSTTPTQKPANLSSVSRYVSRGTLSISTYMGLHPFCGGGSFYDDVIAFCLEVTKFYGRSRMRAIAASVWRSLQGPFDDIEKKIQKHSTEIDLAAQANTMEMINGIAEDVDRIVQSGNPEPAPVGIFIVPDLLSPRFTGRSRQLDDIRTMISNSHADSKRVAVYGMPGAGKSQLLLKFAKDYKVANPESNVFHVDATERETLLQGFEVIYALLSLPRESRQDIVIEKVKDWLTKSSEWLLIVDNVFSTNVVKPFLPGGDSGIILFTMRDDFIARTLGTSGQLELTSMDREESVELILKSAGIDLATARPEDRDKAAELGQEIGGLPLALDQSGTCLSYRHWSLSKYLDLLKREKVETLKLNPSGGTSNFYDTLILTLKHAPPVAVALLMLMAHLDHHNIPMKLLEVAIGEDISILKAAEGSPSIPPKHDDVIIHAVPTIEDSGTPNDGKHGLTLTRLNSKFRRLLHRFHIDTGYSEQKPGNAITTRDTNDTSRFESRQLLQQLFSNSEELENAVSSLSAAALIGRKQEGNIWLHDLVYEISLNLIEPSERPLFSNVAVKLCDLLFPWDIKDPKNWVACEETSTHAVISLRQAETHELIKEEVCRLQHNLAWYYKQRARYDDALKFYSASLDGYGKLFGSAHPKTLKVLNNMAVVFVAQGRNDEALEYYERALAGYENVHGKDHPSTLMTVHNMAGLFNSQGRLEEAQEYFERALAGREKMLGKNHPSTLSTVDSMAQLFDSQGQYEKALEWYKRALDAREKVLGKDHPSTLATVNNMANTLKHMGRSEEALELYERALAGSEKAHRKDHPFTLMTVHNMATLFDNQGRHEEALELYERALAGRNKSLGPEHPNTKNTTRCLSSCKKHIQELSEGSSESALKISPDIKESVA
ncbi:hypothetical protein BDD12DRAFT_808751 [Trichophaea hybrida]|nr:hypothetical protein BDD12DRAFT_808751 [Trichophaea hybrida]